MARALSTTNRESNAAATFFVRFGQLPPPEDDPSPRLRGWSHLDHPFLRRRSDPGTMFVLTPG